MKINSRVLWKLIRVQWKLNRSLFIFFAQIFFGENDFLGAESFCERILFETNDVCHDGNTLLDTEKINMLVVLRMNREFIQHKREIYPKLSGQNFNGALV